LIDNKFDERRDDKKKRAVDELIKIANGVFINSFSMRLISSS
jgi:hypothetical protein